MKDWVAVVLIPQTVYFQAEDASDVLRQIRREHGPLAVARSVECTGAPTDPPSGGTRPTHFELPLEKAA